ncbi:uncharacterized protein LOC143020127 [Oratosquilla oratoria]|uniref:uncharacterized protein LOC143020127 n=1 Tax=Oratosquilla oratoria TaxID=337810 RepID=UPI003F76DA60
MKKGSVNWQMTILNCSCVTNYISLNQPPPETRTDDTTRVITPQEIPPTPETYIPPVDPEVSTALKIPEASVNPPQLFDPAQPTQPVPPEPNPPFIPHFPEEPAPPQSPPLPPPVNGREASEVLPPVEGTGNGEFVPTIVYKPAEVPQQHAFRRNKHVPILHEKRQATGPGSFRHEVMTGNGIKVMQEIAPSKFGGAAVQGSYTFTHPDGTVHTLSYVADENGYQPNSDLLPKAPQSLHPIPPHAIAQIEKAKREHEEMAREGALEGVEFSDYQDEPYVPYNEREETFKPHESQNPPIHRVAAPYFNEHLIPHKVQPAPVLTGSSAPVREETYAPFQKHPNPAAVVSPLYGDKDLTSSEEKKGYFTHHEPQPQPIIGASPPEEEREESLYTFRPGPNVVVSAHEKDEPFSPLEELHEQIASQEFQFEPILFESSSKEHPPLFGGRQEEQIGLYESERNPPIGGPSLNKEELYVPSKEEQEESVIHESQPEIGMVASAPKGNQYFIPTVDEEREYSLHESNPESATVAPASKVEEIYVSVSKEEEKEEEERTILQEPEPEPAANPREGESYVASGEQDYGLTLHESQPEPVAVESLPKEEEFYVPFSEKEEALMIHESQPEPVAVGPLSREEEFYVPFSENEEELVIHESQPEPVAVGPLSKEEEFHVPFSKNEEELVIHEPQPEPVAVGPLSKEEEFYVPFSENEEELVIHESQPEPVAVEYAPPEDAPYVSPEEKQDGFVPGESILKPIVLVPSLETDDTNVPAFEVAETHDARESIQEQIVGEEIKDSTPTEDLQEKPVPEMISDVGNTGSESQSDSILLAPETKNHQTDAVLGDVSEDYTPQESNQVPLIDEEMDQDVPLVENEDVQSDQESQPQQPVVKAEEESASELFNSFDDVPEVLPAEPSEEAEVFNSNPVPDVAASALAAVLSASHPLQEETPEK